MKELSPGAFKELKWWHDNVEHASKPIRMRKPDLVIESDASNQGFGGKCGTIKTGGRWNEQEQCEHINVLEILAIFYVLKAFEHQCDLKDKHIRLMCDNTTGVCYINNMGGSKSQKCNDITNQIWTWCKDRNIWLSAVHLAGILNTDADRESRQFNDDIEWMLDPEFFKEICKIFGKPDIDMFASRLNFQIKPFVSWRPDPESIAVDAFYYDWSNKFIYCFPPFSVIQRVLRK